MAIAYELAAMTLAFLIAHALWQYVFYPLSLLFPVPFVVVTALVVAVLAIAVLLRSAAKELS